MDIDTLEKCTNLSIVESPYAGDIELNTLYARHAMQHAIRLGEAPIASHLLYTQPFILDENIPEERARGIGLGYLWMRRADVVAFYLDLGMSTGMEAALREAQAHFKPIHFRKIPNIMEILYAELGR